MPCSAVAYRTVTVRVPPLLRVSAASLPTHPTFEPPEPPVRSAVRAVPAREFVAASAS